MSEEATQSSLAQARMEEIRRGRFSGTSGPSSLGLIHLILLCSFTAIELAVVRDNGLQDQPLLWVCHALTTAFGLTALSMLIFGRKLGRSGFVGPTFWLLVVLGAQRVGELMVVRMDSVIRFTDAIPCALTGLFFVFGVLRRSFPLPWRLAFTIMALHGTAWMLDLATRVWLSTDVPLLSRYLAGRQWLTLILFISVPLLTSILTFRSRDPKDTKLVYWSCLLIWCWSQTETIVFRQL